MIVYIEYIIGFSNKDLDMDIMKDKDFLKI